MPDFSAFSALIEFTAGIIALLYSYVGDLGLTIILFTIIVRSILIPITLPSLRAQKKMKDIQPELNKLKQKYKGDKKKIQEAQMELYKEHNVNPLAGCIPQIVQLVVLVVLYRSLMFFLETDTINGITVDTQFLWMDLALPDPYYIIPVLAGGFQFLMSLMLAPAKDPKEVSSSKSKSIKLKEDKKGPDTPDMAAQMQKQMMFVMPIMTFFLALKFPSGLGLYWVTTTIFSIVQQYFVSGPGGLTQYVSLIKNKIGSKKS